MGPVDFSKPVTFFTALEALTLTLTLVITQLRDHVDFDESGDHSAHLQAAQFLSALLEDTRQDVEALIMRMELKG
ncbi:MAG: hypothetical protein WCO61_12960 [Alphaproteobacteria bacterium]